MTEVRIYYENTQKAVCPHCDSEIFDSKSGDQFSCHKCHREIDPRELKVVGNKLCEVREVPA